MSSKKTQSKIVAALMALLLAIPFMVGVVVPAHANAKITSESTGSAFLEPVKDGEEFVATRVVNTTYDSGVLSRAFAPGFSYGNNVDNRSDDGLAAYLALTDAAAMSDAYDNFAKQITPASESYSTVAHGTTASFDNLPMGHYIVQASRSDASRSYANMVAYVEPKMVDGQYQLVPAEITVKGEDVVLETPSLIIDKSANAAKIIPGMDIEYKVIVQPGRGSTTIRNVHVSDALSPDTVELGVAINQDIKLVNEDGDEYESAVITYTKVSDVVVGYTIDIPGEFEPTAKFIITYTASTDGVEIGNDIVNIAQTWCEGVDPVSDTVTVITDEEFVETGDNENGGGDGNGNDITEEPTPAAGETQDSTGLFQTGDIIPYVIVGIAGVAVLGLVIALVIRRRRR